MAKQTQTMSEIVESHKPKNFKYKFIINDDDVYKQLQEEGYDLSQLDTINMDELTHKALEAEFKSYERDLIKKAKEPSILDKGIIICKKMITKADKKLLSIDIGFFDYCEREYLCIKFNYEKFSIMEIFIKI